MMCSIRVSLADRAKASDNPNIAQAADDIWRLTAVMLSKSRLKSLSPDFSASALTHFCAESLHVRIQPALRPGLEALWCITRTSS